LTNTDAHGIGEPANAATAAAIANAVYHAIGVRIRELPITPRTVLAALANGKVARS
jgi:xanthine dehydrogenase YagR molybdenum-binding subunit